MNLLESGLLKDGRPFELWRIVTTEKNPAPPEVVRYWMGSTGYDAYRDYTFVNVYWRIYYREALVGNLLPQVVDYLYLAKVDGVWAARLWFGYSLKTGRGNFGNVFTEPEFRRLGLMGMLMNYCVADMRASSLRQVCCCTGSAVAARAYCKLGFEMIYGGETGPLCFSKVGGFQAEVQRCYGDHPCVRIRDGEIGDQFDCDKLRPYTKEMMDFPRQNLVTPAYWLSDYRSAFQEVMGGNGMIKIQETDSGAACNYAFALHVWNQDVLDFGFQMNYLKDLPELIRQTAEAYREKYHRSPVCAVVNGDTERLEAVKSAGLHQLGGLENSYTLWG